MYNAMCERGEITQEKMTFYKQNACPSCGACSFMGTASTHAGYGGGSWTDAARFCTDACYQ